MCMCLHIETESLKMKSYLAELVKAVSLASVTSSRTFSKALKSSWIHRRVKEHILSSLAGVTQKPISECPDLARLSQLKLRITPLQATMSCIIVNPAWLHRGGYLSSFRTHSLPTLYFHFNASSTPVHNLTCYKNCYSVNQLNSQQAR